MGKGTNHKYLTNKIVFLIYFVIVGFIGLITYDFIYSDTSSSTYKNTRIFMDILGMSVLVWLGKSIMHDLKYLYYNLNKNLKQKNQELEKLNTELEQRVRDEVEKNRQKDKIMYQHSRLASMGEMVGNIAHQWRQPLNSLSLIIQSFEIKNLKGQLTDEFIQKQVQEGMRISNMMSKTIDDFRDFFNPNKSKEYFDLKTTIYETISFAQEKDIDITLNCKDGINIFGFKNEFSQVILNLLNNSVDQFNKISGKYDKKILIDVKSKDDKQIITFIDNAGGIKEDIIDKIFDPYFTTKHQATGTGIGLFMSKQIIQKQMKGDITASNIMQNFDHNSYKCAKFTIELPMYQTNVKKVDGKLSIA